MASNKRVHSSSADLTATSKRAKRDVSLAAASGGTGHGEKTQVVSVFFNVNSLSPKKKKNAQLPSEFERWMSMVKKDLQKAGILNGPDLIFLQETKHESNAGREEKRKKDTNDRKEKAEDLLRNDYDVFFAEPARGKEKTCSGAALYVRKNSPIRKGGVFDQPKFDKEGHLCQWTWQGCKFLGCYLPVAGSKVKGRRTREEIDFEMKKYLETEKHVVVVGGDFNVTQIKEDSRLELWAGPSNGARERFKKLLKDCKFRDSYREKYPEARQYSSFQKRWGSGRREKEKVEQSRVDLALVRHGVTCDNAWIFNEPGRYTTKSDTAANVKCLNDSTKRHGSFDHVPIAVRVTI